jgi:hypothetical protein
LAPTLYLGHGIYLGIFWRRRCVGALPEAKKLLDAHPIQPPRGQGTRRQLGIRDLERLLCAGVLAERESASLTTECFLSRLNTQLNQHPKRPLLPACSAIFLRHPP